MVGQRRRTILIAGVVVVAGWILAIAGYYLALNSKMTAEKVRAYAESVDLSRLSAAERARALRKLADALNSLSMEERRRARFDHVGQMWFDQMTDQEKRDFVDQTLPTGFQQMIAAYEQMPEDKRRKAIDDALRHLRQASADLAAGRPPARGPGAPPPGVSPELEQHIRTIGLQAYFTQSSAQTKAELAPLLEELQNVMELNGRLHH